MNPIKLHDFLVTNWLLSKKSSLSLSQFQQLTMIYFNKYILMHWVKILFLATLVIQCAFPSVLKLIYGTEYRMPIAFYAIIFSLSTVCMIYLVVSKVRSKDMLPIHHICLVKEFLSDQRTLLQCARTYSKPLYIRLFHGCLSIETEEQKDDMKKIVEKILKKVCSQIQSDAKQHEHHCREDQYYLRRSYPGDCGLTTAYDTLHDVLLVFGLTNHRHKKDLRPS